MGAKKPSGTSNAVPAPVQPQPSTEPQSYDRAVQTVQPRTADIYIPYPTVRPQPQPAPFSYQQKHMQMLQDRARNSQGPMAQQDAANDQRMNEYGARQAQQEQERAAAERSRGRRRFSWQR